MPNRETARVDLDVADRRVITLLGAMTKRRGHRLVIDALPQLPRDVIALFVGAPIEGRDHVGRALEEHAADRGVSDRVRFMGYVSDERLGQVLSATDVGLCPFRDMSASGALATWISARCPILTSDLPAIRELDALEPGALRTFAPYEAEALAVRIGETLEEAQERPIGASARWRHSSRHRTSSIVMSTSIVRPSAGTDTARGRPPRAGRSAQIAQSRPPRAGRSAQIAQSKSLRAGRRERVAQSRSSRPSALRRSTTCFTSWAESAARMSTASAYQPR